MEQINLQCTTCHENFSLGLGTTKMGAEQMAKQYGKDWVEVDDARDGKKAHEFAQAISAHGSKCGGDLKYGGTMYMC